MPPTLRTGLASHRSRTAVATYPQMLQGSAHSTVPPSTARSENGHPNQDDESDLSNTPDGAGWWRASDDLWYPLEQHPDSAPPPLPPGPPSPPVWARPTNPTSSDPLPALAVSPPREPLFKSTQPKPKVQATVPPTQPIDMRRGLEALGAALLIFSLPFAWVSVNVAFVQIEGGAFTWPSWVAVAVGALCMLAALAPMRLPEFATRPLITPLLAAVALVPCAYFADRIWLARNAIRDFENDPENIFGISGSVTRLSAMKCGVV